MYKQKTADVMRISDWCSDVCFSERAQRVGDDPRRAEPQPPAALGRLRQEFADRARDVDLAHLARDQPWDQEIGQQKARKRVGDAVLVARHDGRVRNRQSHRVAERSEEQTSELPSLMRLSYA